MITLYGITNCSTVVKARKWLEDNKIEYKFHDYKKLGIDKEHLEKWCGNIGWEKVLNRSGMMYRKASDEVKNKIINQLSAIEFMLTVPTSIKRPIVEIQVEGDGELILLGFNVEEYKNAFLNN